MTQNTDGQRGPTRRDYVKYGGAVLGGSLLAGCTGNSTTDAESGNESTATEAQTSATETQTETESDTTTSDESAAFTASMSPVGEVALESAPETVFTRLTHHADMAFALGRGNSVNAMHAPDYYDALWNQFVERLPGVSLDWSGLYSSWEPTKEKLYELDSDVHLADPASVHQLGNWSMADIEEVDENISPWFGNSLSARHQEPPEEWADRYEYYGLWEQFEKVAQAFGERERFEALSSVRQSMLDEISGGLPAASERPTVVMVGASNIEQDIYAYTLDNPGFLTAHTRPLGPRDAFDGSVESGEIVDFETLLEADPDVMLFLGGMQPGTSMPDTRSALKSHPVGSTLTAVQNDRLHPQGARYQGPILNLFQIEMTAKQLYPEQFGAWPTYESGPYPEIPEGERMFDRQRVADVINGDL
ncbi:ABC transporter substrate-binding protein [Haloprofundus marisrubri]|uniref:ABC transporter substrate-binding protein n=1 Tax=Haloprofundus marisrubri TaxID=1514971 RepID=A0A0W1RE20_9EURY|nr:ABC transporter substrate-binding protein [Haloprofundus marisrubri]KTG11515.1 ABC transporter substrate-binding protein [Haloprofundus marisrubri]